MANQKPTSWLEKLEEQLNIDVDWMDPDYIKSMPLVPHDQTSNQILLDIALSSPSNAELLKQTAQELKGQGWLHIYTRMAVLLASKNIDNISGRVLLQTIPSKAYDEQATVDHARLYDQEFKRVGISRKRYCIKIPATGPALNAAKILSQDKDADGLAIPTLGTAIFGLSQAIACSQADMMYISPYFNGESPGIAPPSCSWHMSQLQSLTSKINAEILAHNDLSLWPDVEDPATQHPMSARVIQMLDTYRRLYKETGKSQPKMKLASFLSAKEAIAAAEFGCHSATLPPKVIDHLAQLEYDGSKQPSEGVPKPQPEYEFYQSGFTTPARLQKLATVDPLAAKDWDGKLASTDIDYLANGGAELERTIREDPITESRLREGLEVFTAAENKGKALIESVLASL
ncbi:hypothetical protein VMCG_05343 [Cytospora schulzeri]|uniref:Transaldolase n=1 Tax=Cytospora schulzeri TaxID=448051 RepID=A0A423WJV7_9PEZI|nr:hypothetical protein VMCG_05343 [Valsa malicola]